MAILGMGFVAVLAANLPGHLSYDSVIQLHDGRTGQYHSWHPPIMAWTLGWLDALLPGPVLFVVLDAGLFFASLAALVWASRRVGWAAPVCAALISLSPLVLIYQAIVWKDVFYADCSVAGFVCLSLSDRARAEGRTGEDGRRRRALALAIAAFALFGVASLIRQNGVVTLAAGTGALVWTAVRDSGRNGVERNGLGRGLIAAALALGLTLAGVFAAGRALDTRRVDEPGALAQFKVLQGYDVIGAVAHDPHMALTALTTPANAAPGVAARVRSAARSFYSPTRIDTLANDPGLSDALAEAAPAVSAQWRWMLSHDPGPYLQHRLAVFGWTLFTPDLNRCLPVFTGIDGRPELIRALGLRRGARPRDAALWRYAAGFFHTPVYSHATYGLIALVTAAALLWSRRAGDAAMGFMLLGALGFTASFFLVSVACDYRYLYALDLSAMTAVFYLAVRGLGRPGRGDRGMRMRGSIRAVIGALLLLAFAGAARAAPARYESAPCTGDLDGVAQRVQCGVLSVDETRGGRDRRRVALPVAIVHAAHPTPGLPPVIYLHGGPGGSAIQNLPEMLRGPIGRELVAQDQDWIFFDQRGSRLATPELDCGSAPLNDAGPLTEGAVRTLQACGVRQTAAGVDLARYNSAEVARDVQDLRRALGLKSFDLFGISYGTRVGFAVITHAPQGVRAVVLDSVWPPDIGWAVGGPQMVSNAVKAIFARCAADSACHAAYPTPGPQLDTLSRRLLVAPMVLDGHTYSASDLGGFLMDTAYDPEGARSLPHDVDAFSRGDFTALNTQIADRSEYTEAQHLAFLCKERFPFERRDQVTAAADDAVGQTTVASFRRYFDVCPAYAVGRAEAVENAPVYSPIPTLFLSAEFDPGCPPELARAAAKRFAHGQFVMVPNTTHGIFENSACGRRMIRAFYANPAAAPDVSCLHPEHDRFTFKLK